MKVKEVSRTANVAWSPKEMQAIHLACGQWHSSWMQPLGMVCGGGGALLIVGKNKLSEV